MKLILTGVTKFLPRWMAVTFVAWLFCLFTTSAYAFPPAPYHTLFGIARDQVGQTITAEGAEVVLLKGGKEMARTPVTSSQIDLSYELKIRIDQARSGTTIYSDRALAASGLFSLAVSMRDPVTKIETWNYPIEVSGNLTAGKAVIANVVASRALGDLTDNVPQATVSTLGDAGLAGTMAQLNSDFSVAKGRLGINNPDPYGTLFSLRGELFRILNDDTITSDDDAWKQTMQQYIVPNVMADPDVAKYCNNLKKPDGSAVPGIVLPFRSTIQHGQNYFGLPLAANDHAYTPSSYATKISSVGIVVKGYVGMDPYSFGSPGATSTPSNTTNSLSATPYVYLIPCGSDCMLAPPLGDTNTLRTWTVHDQALPLPYNLGTSAFNTTQFFDANGTLSEQPWILRKHQAFRPVSDAAFFYSSIPAEFTNTRLVGRSVWNGQWKIVIPAYTLLNDEQEGLNRFVASVKDIQLFLRTYSHSGN